jgi:hypothetical protein
MTTTCPIDLDVQRLRSEIANLYTRVASEPDGEFHFHRGPMYAAAFLGYSATELDALPAECSRSFAGIGNPHLIGPIHAGETVMCFRGNHGSIRGSRPRAISGYPRHLSELVKHFLVGLDDVIH